MKNCDAGNELLDLRRSLKRRRVEVGDRFHASSDTNTVRTEVFSLLANHQFDVDVTLLEKSKASPRERESEAIFYKYAWYFHAKFLAKEFFGKADEVYISAAALETRVGKATFRAAFEEVIQQTALHSNFVIDFPMSIADPCLQIADYFAWAVQRRWELQNTDFYQYAEKHIRSEFDLLRRRDTHYY